MRGAQRHTAASNSASALVSREDIPFALSPWAVGNTANLADDAAATPLGLRSWINQFGTDAVTLLSAPGESPALLPIVRGAAGPLPVSIRTWSSPGNFYWRFGYPLVTGNVGLSVSALLRQINARRDWDVLDLGPMLSCSPHFEMLRSAGEALGMHPQVHGQKQAPVVIVQGDWATYYATLDSRLKGSIELGSRRLAKLGPVSLQCFTSGPELPQRLREFLELEASGWKGREGTAISCDPRAEAFYSGLAREAAAEGSLRLYELRVGDTLVAGDLTIAAGRTIHMLKIAYDEQQRRCSPGHVIRKLVLQQLFERGENFVYDLMTGGGEHGDYKRDWANSARKYVKLRLFNPGTLRGRFAGVAHASISAWKRYRALDKAIA
jgi:hypothetical protein